MTLERSATSDLPASTRVPITTPMPMAAFKKPRPSEPRWKRLSANNGISTRAGCRQSSLQPSYTAGLARAARRRRNEPFEQVRQRRKVCDRPRRRFSRERLVEGGSSACAESSSKIRGCVRLLWSGFPHSPKCQDNARYNESSNLKGRNHDWPTRKSIKRNIWAAAPSSSANPNARKPSCARPGCTIHNAALASSLIGAGLSGRPWPSAALQARPFVERTPSRNFQST